MISLVLSTLAGIFFSKLFERNQKKLSPITYVAIFIILFLGTVLASFIESIPNDHALYDIYSVLKKIVDLLERNYWYQFVSIACFLLGIFFLDSRDNNVLHFKKYSKEIREFTGSVHEGDKISIAAGDMDFLGGIDIEGGNIQPRMADSEEYQQFLYLHKTNNVSLRILCRHGLEKDLLESIIKQSVTPETVFFTHRTGGKLHDTVFQQLLRIGKIKTDFASNVDIRFYDSRSEDKQFRGRFIEGDSPQKGIVYRKEKEEKTSIYKLEKKFPYIRKYQKRENLYSVHKLNPQELSYYYDMFLSKWNSCDENNSTTVINFCKSLYDYVNRNQPRFHMALVYVNSYEIARKKEMRKEFPPFGVMYLAAAVRQELDWDVKLIAVDENTPAEKLDWREFDAIGFSIISSYSYDILKRSYQNCKKKQDAVIFAGGYQAELFHSYVFSDFKAHLIFKGESENSIRTFCKHFENHNFALIPGVLYRGIDQSIHPTEGERCVDLNAIKPPARDLIPPEDLVMTDRLAGTDLRMVHILFSRGCSHNCYYCAANQDQNNNRIRYRDKDQICTELKELIGAYQIQGFSVIDDCFLTNKTKAVEICDYIASKNLGLKWSLAARVDNIDEEILTSLCRSGCIEIKFGVETGSDVLLKKMNKQETTADAERAIRLTKKFGIGVKLFIITGLPFETDKTHEETKHFLSKMKDCIDRVSLLRYTPLAGSYIYNHPNEFGIKKSALTRETFNRTSLYRKSYDWWIDKSQYKKCEYWYNDMREFIESNWPES